MTGKLKTTTDIKFPIIVLFIAWVWIENDSWVGTRSPRLRNGLSLKLLGQLLPTLIRPGKEARTPSSLLPTFSWSQMGSPPGPREVLMPASMPEDWSPKSNNLSRALTSFTSSNTLMNSHWRQCNWTKKKDHRPSPSSQSIPTPESFGVFMLETLFLEFSKETDSISWHSNSRAPSILPFRSMEESATSCPRTR